MNGHGGSMKISRDTAEHVRGIAEELGYVGNLFASSLKGRRKKILGVLLSGFELGWSELLLSGVNACLSEAHCALRLGMFDWSPERCAKELESMAQEQVDAIICQPIPEACDAYRKLLRGGVRKLVFIGDLPEASFQAPSVVWDSREAAFDCVGRLAAAGGKRIAFIGAEPRTPMTLCRFEAYEAALCAAGLPASPERVAWLPAGVSAATAVERMLAFGPELRPDACFFMNDGLALSALHCFNSAPGLCAVASLGNLPFSGHPLIALSTMEEPVAKLGYEAAKMALASEMPAADGALQHRIAHMKFIERQTLRGSAASAGA
jgi:DNA-binding LacI/PurR family transcriptional regulator